MENERTMDPQESLELITKVINDSKDNLKSNSFYFLFWGILVGAGCLIHYFLLQSNVDFPPYIAWPVLMIGGGVVSGIKGYMDSKKAGVESYSSMMSKNLWMGLGICYFIVLLIGSRMDFAPIALILMVSGAGTFITGLNIKYTPLVIGGIVLFIAAIACTYITGSELLLICAGALLLGYVIPGFMLKFSK